MVYNYSNMFVSREKGDEQDKIFFLRLFGPDTSTNEQQRSGEKFTSDKRANLEKRAPFEKQLEKKLSQIRNGNYLTLKVHHFVYHFFLTSKGLWS